MKRIISITVIAALVALVTVPAQAQKGDKGDFLPTIVIPKGMVALQTDLVSGVQIFTGELNRKCPSGDCDRTGIVALTLDSAHAGIISRRPDNSYVVIQGMKLLQHNIRDVLLQYERYLNQENKRIRGEIRVNSIRPHKENADAKRNRKKKLLTLKLELRELKKRRKDWFKTLESDLLVLAEKECFIILNVGIYSQEEYEEMYGTAQKKRPKPPAVQKSSVSYYTTQ